MKPFGKVLDVKEISQRILEINVKRGVILGSGICMKEGQNLLILLENNFQFRSCNELFFYKSDLFKK